MHAKEFIRATETKEEHSVEEFNLFTAVDENVPSPEEVQAEETIVLPEIQSMSAYIRQHYEDEIIKKCAHKIVAAELIAVYEGKRFQNTSRQGALYCEEEIALTDEDFLGEWEEPRKHHPVGGVFAADIRPVKGAITWMIFHRVAECYVEADLTIEMKLNFRYGSRGRFKQITQRYYADLWLDMEDGINVEYGNFRLYHHAKDRPSVKLDDYLVPVFSGEDIENEAETIILNTVSEGLTADC